MTRVRSLSTWRCVGLILGLVLHTAHAVAACAPTSRQALPSGWPGRPHAGQVRVPAGQLTLGSEGGYADERPRRTQQVAAFWMDRTEVTNAQFDAFVRATGHRTDAERQGGAALFVVPTAQALEQRALAWWRFVPGADWRHPQGPDSDLSGRWQQPVVLVTQADALAYARWLGRDLPTEVEWEHAAKAGRQGPELDAAPRQGGKPAANYWQGSFPLMNTQEDGHAGLAPVGCYAPNAWGLYDMIGNAWEWTRDGDSGPRQGHANGDAAQVVPVHLAATGKVVIKGGSYLCSPDYCARYRASARESQEPDLPTSHVGFRTISRR